MIPLMSFWPSIYDKIAGQVKLIEYRRTFPKNCTYAYMYVSKPVKAICGIVYFGNKHSLENWKEQYSDDEETSNRIKHYAQSYRFGMEIIGFQRIKPITLEDLRNNVEGFVAPQSYLLLDNNKNLAEYIKKSTVKIDDRIENDLSNIFPEHICKRY
ncbi:hypothetical protein [Bacillus sp. BC08]